LLEILQIPLGVFWLNLHPKFAEDLNMTFAENFPPAAWACFVTFRSVIAGEHHHQTKERGDRGIAQRFGHLFVGFKNALRPVGSLAGVWPDTLCLIVELPCEKGDDQTFEKKREP
jgi:hypothetical protein